MNKSITAILVVTLAVCMGNAVAQVTVKQISLEWEATANLNGEGLYNNLCSACHGVSGEGNGPAASALQKEIPDLRMLALNNDGVYAHKKVKRAICGSSREIVHGTIDMPDWEQQFMYVNPAWSDFTREAYARKRINALSKYVETLQLDEPAQRVIAARP
jgi:mono/diheme cytochrome c family protein